MDTIKTGRFLAELRHERELTQEQLAERLGISNKTISRWENGSYMPPVEMLAELSELYGVSINEIISGKRLDGFEEKKAADENLKDALNGSPFTFEERRWFYTQKWKRDHALSLTLEMIAIVIVLIIGLCLKSAIFVILAIVWGLAFGIVSHNQMTAYVEHNAFDGKNNLGDKQS